jgi:hypothetical protein
MRTFLRKYKLFSCKLIADCADFVTQANQRYPTPRIFSKRGEHVFFGYYDLSPFSSDASKLLAVQIEKKINYSGVPAVVGYYSLTSPENIFTPIGESFTWCWQQACRLQWYPRDSSQMVLYNRIVDENYGAVIQDIASKQIVRAIRRPLYAVSNDGRFGLSLDFSRLQRLRPGYGYSNLPDETADEEAPKESGIWLVDLNSMQDRMLFSVAEIVGFMPLDSMKEAFHYFNHLLFSPDGSRFLFYHCWTKAGKRYGRMITCNRDGTDRYAVINEGHASHYTWKNAKEILVYATHKDQGTRYYLYTDKSKKREIIGNNVLNEDGHPSFVKINGVDHILLDSYPDAAGYQKLLLYNCEDSTCSVLGKFFAPFEFRGEYRCDLHPRNSAGRYITFDAIHNGCRALHMITIGQR